MALDSIPRNDAPREKGEELIRDDIAYFISRLGDAPRGQDVRTGLELALNAAVQAAYTDMSSGLEHAKTAFSELSKSGLVEAVELSELNTQLRDISREIDALRVRSSPIKI
jgi:hypothetical protein